MINSPWVGRENKVRDNAVKRCINITHSHNRRPTHGNGFNKLSSDTKSSSSPVKRTSMPGKKAGLRLKTTVRATASQKTAVIMWTT